MSEDRWTRVPNPPKPRVRRPKSDGRKLVAIANKFYSEYESPDPEDFHYLFEFLVVRDLRGLLRWLRDEKEFDTKGWEEYLEYGDILGDELDKVRAK